MTNLDASTNRIRVALIYGGASGEHSVSCATAGAIMRALDAEKYDVLPIGIRRDGTWVPGETDAEKLVLDTKGVEVGESVDRIVFPAGDGTQSLLKINKETFEMTELGLVDVVFPVLHGPFGEDGTIQGLLELAGIPYVGCGVLASAAGMDKHYMKVVLESAGLPVSPYVVATKARWERDRDTVLAEVRELSFPVFVKPARAGSSLGISKVDQIGQLATAVENAQKHDPKVIIEQGLVGSEVECAVLGGTEGERAKASTVGEIVLNLPEGSFYDFEHKYVETDALTMQIPARLDEETASRVRELSVAAFEAFGCEGLVRVDSFVCADGPVINEINTMPGFTPFSMYPALWEATGVPYSQLVDELIRLALSRPTGLR